MIPAMAATVSASLDCLRDISDHGFVSEHGK
jgi:hypothetical protein